MSLNLSRNAVAMEKALGFLADAERALEDCSSCLARDVIVSDAQATEHNRSIVGARNALHALRGQIQSEHGEICRHLRDAQMAFLQSKPLVSLATGYTDGESNAERELDLSAYVYESNESEVAQSENVDGFDFAQETQQPFALLHPDRNRRLFSWMLSLFKMLAEVPKRLILYWILPCMMMIARLLRASLMMGIPMLARLYEGY